jgi:hypothetical protein
MFALTVRIELMITNQPDDSTGRFNKIACRLCFPNAIDHGELIPGYFLVNQGESWFLVNSDGHDRLFVFGGKPYSEPYKEQFAQDDDWEPSLKEWAKWESWQREVELFSIAEGARFQLEQSMTLGISCHEAGWCSMDGNLKFWLIERAARLLRDGQIVGEFASSIALHREAEKWMGTGDLFLVKNQIARAAICYNRAADFESRALELIPEDKPVTRQIITASMAALRAKALELMNE